MESRTTRRKKEVIRCSISEEEETGVGVMRMTSRKLLVTPSKNAGWGPDKRRREPKTEGGGEKLGEGARKPAGGR